MMMTRHRFRPDLMNVDARPATILLQQQQQQQQLFNKLTRRNQGSISWAKPRGLGLKLGCDEKIINLERERERESLSSALVVVASGVLFKQDQHRRRRQAVVVDDVWHTVVQFQGKRGPAVESNTESSRGASTSISQAQFCPPVSQRITCPVYKYTL